MVQLPQGSEHLPVIFLMGATACGKTALSVSLAARINAEIISVDSALVYRGMDIGTAKPTQVEQAGIRHHLINICDIWETYSAARFVHDAQLCIEQIQARGKRVLLVGGTMLYFKALEQGLAKLPEADATVRATIAREAASKGWPALHGDLEKVDRVAAARIHPNDPQRLQRALEVYRLTGIPMSRLQADTQPLLARAPQKFALVPQDRTWLHQRIEQRFHGMLEHGFLQELVELRKDPRIRAELAAMRSVGYRQGWEYLDAHTADNVDNQLPATDPANDALWVDKAKAATRQLAKRQLTWLRGMQNVTLVACDELSLSEQEQIICSSMNSCDVML